MNTVSGVSARGTPAGAPSRGLLTDETGAAPAEVLLVTALLSLLMLAAMQFGLALYARNLVLDAAVEGAFYAALADTTTAQGEQRVYEVASHSVAGAVLLNAKATEAGGVVTMTVTATLPILGIWGVSQAMEVTAYAPAETLDR